MPHRIPQPPPDDLLTSSLAIGAVALGFLVMGWQTWRGGRIARWWHLTTIWAVPGLLAGLFFFTCSPNGRILFDWSPVVGVVLLCWGLLAAAQRGDALPKPFEERFLAGLLSLAAGFGVLCLLLAPAVMSARHAARRSSHKCSMMQIGLAAHNYHDIHETIPIPALGDPPHSWRVAVLPYLDAKELYDRYQFEASWDADENSAIARTPQRTCTWRDYQDWHDSLDRCYTAVAMITGPGTLWEENRPRKISDISDGTSNTILAGEAAGWQIVWTEPRDVDVREATWDINRPGPLPDISDSLLSSFHEGGAYVLLADGTVRFLSDKIEPEILKALVTPKGHDVVVGEF